MQTKGQYANGVFVESEPFTQRLGHPCRPRYEDWLCATLEFTPRRTWDMLEITPIPGRLAGFCLQTQNLHANIGSYKVLRIPTWSSAVAAPADIDAVIGRHVDLKTFKVKAKAFAR